MMATKLIRLVTGEMLMAGFEASEDIVTLKKPAMIVMVDKNSVGMVPWIPFSDEDSVEIAGDKIMYVTNPNKELANEYSMNFGSGLVMPTAGLKIAGE
jgi:hypothetical protein